MPWRNSWPSIPRTRRPRFLLGYQYVMMGHNDAARKELTKSLFQAPRDLLAAKVLTQIGGTVPESVQAIQRQIEKDLPRTGAGPMPGAAAPALSRP